jgi:hypothetical protein
VPNIKTLLNFDPPATQEEIHAASLHLVREVSAVHWRTTRDLFVFTRAT